MTKHTPGPWTLRAAQLDIHGQADPRGETVIAFVTGNRGKDIAHANQRLIAAAPEMLKLLRRACEDGTPCFRNQARALIAKVEGDR